MSCKKECISRRKFLESIGAVGGALALSSPLIAALTGCSQQPLSSPLGQGSSSVNVANSADNIYSFDFANFPALQNPGGSIQATIQATSGTKNVFITRVDANTVETVSIICTHAGCALNAYNSSSEQYACPSTARFSPRTGVSSLDRQSHRSPATRACSPARKFKSRLLKLACVRLARARSRYVRAGRRTDRRTRREPSSS